jgi:uncharacterized protein YbjT (DUF2867 family)
MRGAPSSAGWRPLGHDVVAMARDVQAASRRLPSGIALRVADYEDASALKRALAGIDDMVLISSDGDASAVMRHHANAIEAAIGILEFTILRWLCIMHYRYRSYVVVATW